MTALLVMVSAGASAIDFTVDGLSYNILSSDDKTCVVTEGSYGYSGDVVIPESVTCDKGTFTVVGIEDKAFSYSDVVSVTIANTVENIGTNTFYLCDKLKKVVLPEGLTEIGNNVFQQCKSLTDIDIPVTVTSIGSYAFGECSSLTSVNLPDALMTIGFAAFMNTGLTEIVIPDNVTSVGMMAFYGCKLVNITIGKSVDTMEQGVFFSVDSSLKSVNVLNPVPPGLGNILSVRLPWEMQHCMYLRALWRRTKLLTGVDISLI